MHLVYCLSLCVSNLSAWMTKLFLFSRIAGLWWCCDRNFSFWDISQSLQWLLEGSLVRILRTVKMNSLKYSFSSSGGISSSFRSSFFDARNCCSTATFCKVFFLVLSFSCSEMKSSTGTSKSLNLDAILFDEKWKTTRRCLPVVEKRLIELYDFLH